MNKPPLGFWIEAASALLFGLNDFSLALPNALSGGAVPAFGFGGRGAGGTLYDCGKQ